MHDQSFDTTSHRINARVGKVYPRWPAPETPGEELASPAVAIGQVLLIALALLATAAVIAAAIEYGPALALEYWPALVAVMALKY
jgi:hypothetical protein